MQDSYDRVDRQKIFPATTSKFPFIGELTKAPLQGSWQIADIRQFD